MTGTSQPVVQKTSIVDDLKNIQDTGAFKDDATLDQNITNTEITTPAPAAQPAPAATIPAPAPVYSTMNKTFGTTEELVEYVKTLENQAGKPVPAVETVQTAPVVTANQIFDSSYKAPEISTEQADQIFVDPQAYTQNIINTVTNAFEKKDVAQNMQNQVWKDFYEKNPDLINNKEVVNLVLEARKNSSNLGRDYKEVMTEIATETRNHVLKIQGKNGAATEVMTNQQTINLEGSKAPGAVITTPVVEQPTSFFDEVRSFRDR